MRHAILAAFAACILLSSPIYALERAGAKKPGTVIRYGSAMAGAIQSNAVVFSFNYFVGQTDFSRVSANSIRHNLSCEWDWDQSAYQTNQFGHPYQGSTYFAAGRSNGLGFYQSALIAGFGSASWELFGERNEPSVNDLVQTTVGGTAFGEMMHRLYLEAAATGTPFAFFISPMSALNYWINHERPVNPGRNIQSMTLVSGLGFSRSIRTEDGRNCLRDMNNTPSIASGISLQYGDPFEAVSEEPFEQFKLDIALSGGLGQYGCTVYSDGILASWAPFDELDAATSVGIALNFDCLFTSNVRFTSNALTAAINHKRAITPVLSERISAYAGWMMFGVGTFYEEEARRFSGEEDSSLNYGTGAAAKYSYCIEHLRYGSLGFAAKLYAMKVFPGTVEKADGVLFCQIYEVRGVRPVTRRASIYALGTYVRERCRPEDAPSQLRESGDATVGVEWSVE